MTSTLEDSVQENPPFPSPHPQSENKGRDSWLERLEVEGLFGESTLFSLVLRRFFRSLSSWGLPSSPEGFKE